MEIRNLLFAGTVASLALVNHAAHAQADMSPRAVGPDKSMDERIVAKMAEKQKGGIMIDAVITNAETGVVRCEVMEVGLATSGGSPFFFDVSNWSFGTFKPRANVLYLPPGEYRVSSVRCRTSSRMIFSGPHARFSVRAGELADLGQLNLKFATKRDEGLFSSTGTGALEKSVGSVSPEVRAHRRQVMPKTMARTVSRPMTIIGPAKVGIKTKQKYGY
jgi:hypothetical protein